jgi:hypothetical protein
VRGGVSRGIGFLGDLRRMNVGLTRAKNSLFILGNADALKTNAEWRGFVGDAQERGMMGNWGGGGENVEAFPGNLFGEGVKRKEVAGP